MQCKRCGKSLGTDRGICPFCGAMLTKEQMNQYKKDNLEKMMEAHLITEKYGEKPIYYEKRKKDSSKLIGIFFILLILLIFLVITLVIVLNS